METTINEIITFDKYVSKVLGPEIVKQLKTHYIVTNGQLKPVIDYIFSNLYSEKHAKLISLNIKVETFNRSNNGYIDLLKSNDELKRKINEIKSTLNKEDNEIANLMKNIKNVQNKLYKTKNDLLEKQSNNLLKETVIKNAHDISNQLEASFEKLDFISNTKSGLDSQMNLADSIKRVNLQAADELQKIDIQVTKSLDSELELITYRVGTNQHLNNDKVLAKKSIFDKVNDLSYEIIEKNCEREKFKRDKENYSKQINDVKGKISEFLRKNYQTHSMLYGQYLKRYLMYKNTESNLNEIDCCLSFLDNEINYLSSNTSLVQEKQKQLNHLHTKIHLKQAQIYEIFKENIIKLAIFLPKNINQMKSYTGALIDLVYCFNSNIISKSKLDSTFNPNNGILTALCNKITFKNKKELKKDDNSVEWSFFKDDITNSLRSFFDRFILVFSEIKCKLKELEKYNESFLRLNNIKHMISELKIVLNKCKKIEMDMLHYTECFEQKYELLNTSNEDLAQLEKLIHVWKIQPGVYNCILDNFTFKDKQLDYYLNLIDQAIANHERIKIIKQIKH